MGKQAIATTKIEKKTKKNITKVSQPTKPDGRVGNLKEQKTAPEQPTAAKKSKVQKKKLMKKRNNLQKRKQKTAASLAKNDDAEEEASDEEDVTENAETPFEPTVTEMEAVYKPENQKNVESVRAKKRKIHENNLEIKKSKKDDKEKSDIQLYLESWKTDKDNWKFAKLKQYYLQNNCFDTNLVQDEVWEIALEYLANTKGSGRTLLLKRAKKLIDRIEEQVAKIEDKSVTDFPNYNRARELMQTLQ